MIPPFIKAKQDRQVGGVIVKTRTPDNPEDSAAEQADDRSAAIEACANDLINAVHARDVRAAAAAMKAAFDILESMPPQDEPTGE